MADRKIVTKRPIPLPKNKGGHQKVQKLVTSTSLAPKPKRKLAKAVQSQMKKESEYAELKRVDWIDIPNYEILSPATRQRQVPDTKKGYIYASSTDSESDYDDIQIPSRQNKSSSPAAKMSAELVTELGIGEKQVTVDPDAQQTQEERGAYSTDPELDYDEIQVSSVQYHKLKRPQAKTSWEQVTAEPGSTERDKIHYEEVDIQPHQDYKKLEIHTDDVRSVGFNSCSAHNISNYGYDDPESRLSEKDFHTNCCYAYRKGILAIGITATAVVILVVVLAALATVGLFFSIENSQSVASLRSAGFNTLTVQNLIQNISAIREELSQLSSKVNSLDFMTSNETKLINTTVANLEEFADWVTREAIGLNATWNSLQTDGEMLHSSLVQLARLAVPTDCVVSINEKVVINTTQACSPSFNLGFEMVSINT